MILAYDPVPFAVLGRGRDDTCVYSEKEAKKGSFGLMVPEEFVSMLFGRE